MGAVGPRSSDGRDERSLKMVTRKIAKIACLAYRMQICNAINKLLIKPGRVRSLCIQRRERVLHGQAEPCVFLSQPSSGANQAVTYSRLIVCSCNINYWMTYSDTCLTYLHVSMYADM